MWKSPAVSGSIKRICAAAPAWKFSESRAVLSAYEITRVRVGLGLRVHVLGLQYFCSKKRSRFRCVTLKASQILFTTKVHVHVQYCTVVVHVQYVYVYICTTLYGSTGST